MDGWIEPYCMWYILPSPSPALEIVTRLDLFHLPAVAKNHSWLSAPETSQSGRRQRRQSCFFFAKAERVRQVQENWCFWLWMSSPTKKEPAYILSRYTVYRGWWLATGIFLASIERVVKWGCQSAVASSTRSRPCFAAGKSHHLLQLLVCGELGLPSESRFPFGERMVCLVRRDECWVFVEFALNGSFQRDLFCSSFCRAPGLACVWASGRWIHSSLLAQTLQGSIAPSTIS